MADDDKEKTKHREEEEEDEDDHNEEEGEENKEKNDENSSSSSTNSGSVSNSSSDEEEEEPHSSRGAGSSDPHPFHYSLCYCCKSCDSCMESWFCFYCQLSRQFKFLSTGEKQKKCSVFYTCLFLWVDVCCVTLVGSVIVAMIRNKVREHYSIKGSLFRDCVVGCCCCRGCTVQQNLLEFTVMGDFPGATCYDGSAPSSEIME